MKGVDFTELDEFVTDLRQAGARAAMQAVPVMHRAANNVQRTARDLAPAGPTTPAYPDSITYDLEIASGAIAVEVGPDKDRRQGALGNILEYGTSTHPPHPHLGPALDQEELNLEKHLAELGADAIGRR